MKILMRAVHVDVKPVVREAIERRLQAGLSRFELHIVRTEVWVVDLNGPRGGRDKSCRIRVRLRPRGKLFLQETDADVTLAVDRAVDRLVTSLTRTVERRRDLRRGRGMSRRLLGDMPA